MPTLPARFAGIFLAFAPLFVHRSWRHAQRLLVGAILTPGQRTVTSVLPILGRAHERRFVNSHRILNRAAWRPRSGSRVLLRLLIAAFAPRGPVVAGLLAARRINQHEERDQLPSASTLARAWPMILDWWRAA